MLVMGYVDHPPVTEIGIATPGRWLSDGRRVDADAVFLSRRVVRVACGAVQSRCIALVGRVREAIPDYSRMAIVSSGNIRRSLQLV